MTESLQHPTLELIFALREMCACLVMTEQLRCPTLELTYALGKLCACLVMIELMHALRELMYTLGDTGVSAAPHTGAAMHYQGCGADICAW